MKRRPTETNATGVAIDPRDKNFLTETEMNRFLEAARRGRHGVRDHLLMLLAYRQILLRSSSDLQQGRSSGGELYVG